MRQRSVGDTAFASSMRSSFLPSWASMRCTTCSIWLSRCAKPTGSARSRRRMVSCFTGYDESDRVERVAQVAPQVVDVLDPARQAHERIVDTQCRALRFRNRAVRHQRGMLDQAFDAAEALGEREEPAPLEKAFRSREIGLEPDRYHSAEGAHLPLR